MNEKYLLEQLFQKSAACRKAQQEYYGYKGDLKTDALKKSYLQESRRREQDLDRLLVTIRSLMPELATEPVKP